MIPAVGGKLPTRDRILQVAKTLFAKKGYEGTGTAAIARMASTSESQLMKHFGSKAGILEAIFTESWKDIANSARDAMQSSPTGPHKLQAIAQVVLAKLQSDSELKLLMLLEGRRLRAEVDLVSPGFVAMVELVDSVMIEMHRDGMIRPGLHPHAVRSALMGMLEGLLRDRFLAERMGFPADYSLQDLGVMLRIGLAAFTVEPSQNQSALPE